MTDHEDSKDPGLAALFADADEELRGEEFAASVQQQMTRRRSSLQWIRIGAFGVVALILWLLSGPLIQFSGWLVEFLTMPLIDTGDSFIADMASPLNSGSIIVGVLFFTVWKFWRRLQGN